MRPHTFSMPKPLMHVAGKPMLGHILDRLKSLKPSKIHFVISEFRELVEKFVSKYDYEYTITCQERLSGDGGAIMLTKDLVNPESDVLVVFSDTIFETDFGCINPAREKNQGILWVKEVDDPHRFGIVVLEDGFIKKMIEKPDEPPSNLALVGMYYIPNAKKMFCALDEIYKKKIQSKGEYRLIDALQILIDKGERFAAEELEKWFDCGTPESLLETNNELLKSLHKKIRTENSVIIEPVYIEEGAKIKNSIIGPGVSVGSQTVIENSIVRNSIVGENALIECAQLDSSLIGSKAAIKGVFKQVSIAENSQVQTKNI